ncbi:hypothetical protein FSP39_024093 [Pinctada imbricata]|uniref:Uncharacterized protein n=1 Tax=Pinctada imbricata TaxID=66713 RepID=A0AA88YJZ5_PINIB|nr:hypothetical protein FSP39_024093 [Pinctada imbricata]
MCTHCGLVYRKKKKGKGFYRMSVENTLSNGTTGREILGELCGVAISKPEYIDTDGSNNNFVCDGCWSTLNRIVKYRKALEQFWEKASSSSLYVKLKRKHEQSKNHEQSKEHEQSKDNEHSKDNMSQKGVKRNFNHLTDHLYHEQSNDVTDEMSEEEEQQEHVAKKGRFYAEHPEKRVEVPKKKKSPNALSQKFETVWNGLKTHKYRKVIRNLWFISKRFRYYFREEVTKLIRQEVSGLIKMDTKFPLCQEVTLQNIQEFSWETTMSIVEEQAPTLFSALKGVATKKGHSLKSSKGQNLEQVVGTALSCLLKGREPKRTCFIPTMNAVQLWKGGLKLETLTEVSQTRFCTGYHTAVRAIKKLGDEFDNVAVALSNHGNSESVSDSESVKSTQDQEVNSEDDETDPYERSIDSPDAASLTDEHEESD